jgi:hypothetical protein
MSLGPDGADAPRGHDNASDPLHLRAPIRPMAALTQINVPQSLHREGFAFLALGYEHPTDVPGTQVKWQAWRTRFV